jgi:tRNA A-37 threonylcarbamoyl transferase component Bud32
LNEVKSTFCIRCHKKISAQAASDAIIQETISEVPTGTKPELELTVDLGKQDQTLSDHRTAAASDPMVNDVNQATLDSTSIPSMVDQTNAQPIVQPSKQVTAIPGQDCTLDLSLAPIERRDFDSTLAERTTGGPTGNADFTIDQGNILVTATIHIGADGMTVGRSQVPSDSPTKATAVSNVSGTDSRKSPHTIAGSIWSTISRRTLSSNKELTGNASDYTIVRKLGEGGMGVVYVARQKALDREVAVKAIKAGKTDTEESRRKFFYEAQITGELDHPNIVPIHEIGANDDGTLFYSMKMVDGTPWEKVIRQKSREENLEIYMKVCDAVAFAHARNIIHRDLKPENVMLGAFGEVLVMDWGLALDLNENSPFGLSGTPAYMAPEMASHQVPKIRQCSDVYILGGILFQIVTGRAPHTGTSVRDCLVNAQRNAIVEVALEDPLIDIARKAMATAPSDRYASVLDLQKAIRDHMRHAESISLTKRARELLARANQNKDYDGFARCIFSLQEAMEMWPENEDAKQGCVEAKRDYAQCAFHRKDFDLCIQTLDAAQPMHLPLLKNAQEQRSIASQRESRMRMMRKTLIGVISVATILLSVATYYANYQAGVARKQERLALDSAKQERLAKENEANARQQAQKDRDAAIVAQHAAEIAATKEAEAKRVATQARNEAIDNARATLLGNYQSLLGLAMLQNTLSNVQRSGQLLGEIDSIESQLSNSFVVQSTPATVPSLKNWAYRRITLLNNSDISRTKLLDPRASWSIAEQSAFALLGDQSGRIERRPLEKNGQHSTADHSLTLGRPIVSAAIAPDGKDAIVSMAAKPGEPTLLRWSITSDKTVPLELPHSGEMPFIRWIRLGKGIVAGINGGLWVWNTIDGPPKRINCRGQVRTLETIGQEQSTAVGVLALPNGSVACVLFDFDRLEAETIPLPQELSQKVTSACGFNDRANVIVGTQDGALFKVPLIPSQTASNPLKEWASVSIPVGFVPNRMSEQLEELEPRKHSAAIRGIKIKGDQLITYGDEPVIHVWSSTPSSGLSYVCHLPGLTENVRQACFGSTDDIVLAVDQKGTAIQWSIRDQLLRQSVLPSTSPASIIAHSTNRQGTLDIDEFGAVRSVLNGTTEPIDSSGWERFGHSPDALVRDSCIASDLGLIATAATLPGKTDRYAIDASDKIEICIWDYAHHAIKKKMQFQSDGTPRITFLPQKELVLVCDGHRCHPIPLGTPNTELTTRLQSLEFNAAFAVSNPVNPDRFVLVSPVGALLAVDLSRTGSESLDGLRNSDLAIKNRYSVVEGTWSNDGKRFFLLFENGRIAKFEWDQQQFNLLGASNVAEIKSLLPTNPWESTDLATLSDPSPSDTLRIVNRAERSELGTKLSDLRWEMDGKTPTLVDTRLLPGTVRLDPSGSPMVNEHVDKPQTSTRIAQYRDATARIDVYSDGRLMRKDVDATERILGFGRIQSAACSSDHKLVAIVDFNHQLMIGWKQGSQWRWQTGTTELKTLSQVVMESRGKRVVCIETTQDRKPSAELLQIPTEPSEWVSLGTMDGITAVASHPAKDQFVGYRTDGRLVLFDFQAKSTEIVLPGFDQAVKKISQLSILTERFEKLSTTAYHAILVAETAQGDELKFIPLDPSAVRSNIPSTVLGKRVTALSASMDEPLYAIGDEDGGVSVWFATPTIDPTPRELFALPGHRGASLQSVGFSDGSTDLITADSQKRMFVWRGVPRSDPK